MGASVRKQKPLSSQGRERVSRGATLVKPAKLRKQKSRRDDDGMRGQPHSIEHGSGGSALLILFALITVATPA